MQVERQNYSEIVQSAKFKELMASKKRFIWSYTVFFLLFYFSLPLLTAYTKVLNHEAIGVISWAWIFAFAQFIMTWTLCIIYTRKSAKFDKLIEEIKQEGTGEKG